LRQLQISASFFQAGLGKLQLGFIQRPLSIGQGLLCIGYVLLPFSLRSVPINHRSVESPPGVVHGLLEIVVIQQRQQIADLDYITGLNRDTKHLPTDIAAE